jgi:hypothetical protein
MSPAHTTHTAPGAHSSVHTSPAAAFAQVARCCTLERGCMRSVVAHQPPLDPLTHRSADRPGTRTPPYRSPHPSAAEPARISRPRLFSPWRPGGGVRALANQPPACRRPRSRRLRLKSASKPLAGPRCVPALSSRKEGSLIGIQTSTPRPSRRTLPSRPCQPPLLLRPSSFLADRLPFALRRWLLPPPQAPHHVHQQPLSWRMASVALRRFMDCRGGLSTVLHTRIPFHTPFPFHSQYTLTILPILSLPRYILHPLCLPPRTLSVQFGLLFTNLHSLYLNEHVPIH